MEHRGRIFSGVRTLTCLLLLAFTFGVANAVEPGKTKLVLFVTSDGVR